MSQEYFAIRSIVSGILIKFSNCELMYHPLLKFKTIMPEENDKYTTIHNLFSSFVCNEEAVLRAEALSRQ